MLPIGDLHSCIIISLTLQAAPNVDYLLQHCPSVPYLGRVRHWQLNIFVPTVEKPRVALIEVHGSDRWRSCPCSYRIARLLCNPPKYVGTNIPAAQGVQAPVGGYSRDGGVVIVECGVCGADE